MERRGGGVARRGIRQRLTRRNCELGGIDMGPANNSVHVIRTAFPEQIVSVYRPRRG